MGGSYMIYYLLVGFITMIGMYVKKKLQAKFHQYTQIGIANGMSGREVSAAMLAYYGIKDVKIVRSEKMLSDHYNPLTKTVALSPHVYEGRSIASTAVAAHEVGHAVQHHQSYPMLKMRSALVPLVKMASLAQGGLLMVALLMAESFPQLLLLVVIAFTITTFFSLITLPVEFDASNRALNWLEKTQFTNANEHKGAKDALWWAAMTYVAAALSSLAILVFLILSYKKR